MTVGLTVGMSEAFPLMLEIRQTEGLEDSAAFRRYSTTTSSIVLSEASSRGIGEATSGQLPSISKDEGVSCP